MPPCLPVALRGGGLHLGHGNTPATNGIIMNDQTHRMASES
jgi:hypothetical protein